VTTKQRHAVFDTELNEVRFQLYGRGKQSGYCRYHMDGEKCIGAEQRRSICVLDKSFNLMAQYKNPITDASYSAPSCANGLEQPLQISIGCENSFLFFSYYPIPLHSLSSAGSMPTACFDAAVAVAVLALLVHNQRRKRLFHWLSTSG
jgi:hypothetical protein